MGTAHAHYVGTLSSGGEQHVSSLSLRSGPASTAHRFDDGPWRDVVQVAGGGGDAGVAEVAVPLASASHLVGHLLREVESAIRAVLKGIGELARQDGTLR